MDLPWPISCVALGSGSPLRASRFTQKIPCVASGEGGAEPEIEVESTGERVVVLRLLGEHDLASANALTEALAPVLESGRSVVLDVRSVSSSIPRSFIESFVHEPTPQREVSASASA